MPTPEPRAIEQIAIRKLSLLDGDKVRYRVYRSATEFVTVIAESALMAMKLAEIPEPFRIMRDVPTSGATIAPERMAQMENAAAEKILLRVAAQAIAPEPLKVVITETRSPEPFTSIRLSDLQSTSAPKEPEIATPAPEDAKKQPKSMACASVESPAENPPPHTHAPTAVLTPEQVDALLKG